MCSVIKTQYVDYCTVQHCFNCCVCCICEQVVIGNLLETRKKEVIVVTPSEHKWIRLTDEQLASETEIEKFIVKDLVSRHTEYCSS